VEVCSLALPPPHDWQANPVRRLRLSLVDFQVSPSSLIRHAAKIFLCFFLHAIIPRRLPVEHTKYYFV
jgi:hypothetical protein